MPWGNFSVHGCNKCQRDLWGILSLYMPQGQSSGGAEAVSGVLVQHGQFDHSWTFGADVISEMGTMSSPFVIFTEGWLLLRNHERMDLLREVSLLDLEFGHAMLVAVCVQQDPTLDTMD